MHAPLGVVLRQPARTERGAAARDDELDLPAGHRVRLGPGPSGLGRQRLKPVASSEHGPAVQALPGRSRTKAVAWGMLAIWVAWATTWMLRWWITSLVVTVLAVLDGGTETICQDR